MLVIVINIACILYRAFAKSRSQLAFPLDTKSSETLGWVSVLRSLMSWPLEWQSTLPAASQSPHWEASPVFALFTLRCPYLRQGQPLTHSWLRLVLRSGATSDRVADV